MEFLLVFKLQNVTDTKAKLETVVELLSNDLSESSGQFDYNKKYLNQIVISESSKAYLVKDVKEINKDEVFKPYKDLCSKIANIITDYDPTYKFPRSLSSTLIETSHTHQFFSNFLPKLTDSENVKDENFTYKFLYDLVFKVLKKN